MQPVMIRANEKYGAQIPDANARRQRVRKQLGLTARMSNTFGAETEKRRSLLAQIAERERARAMRDAMADHAGLVENRMMYMIKERPDFIPHEWDKAAIGVMRDPRVMPAPAYYNDVEVVPTATKEDIASAVSDMMAISSMVERLLDTRQQYEVPGQITAPLLAMGWKRAGEGAFSTVWIKGELALKINRNVDASARYTKWAKNNAGAPGVPVVHAFHEDRKGRYLAILDRYDEYQEGQSKRNDDAFKDVRAVLHSHAAPKTPHGAAMQAMWERIKGSPDVHALNVMVCRRTKQLVVTDPLAW